MLAHPELTGRGIQHGERTDRKRGVNALHPGPRRAQELAALIAGAEMGEDPGDGALLLRVPDRLDLLEIVSAARGDDPRERHTYYVVRMFLMNLPVEQCGSSRRRRGPGRELATNGRGDQVRASFQTPSNADGETGWARVIPIPLPSTVTEFRRSSACFIRAFSPDWAATCPRTISAIPWTNMASELGTLRGTSTMIALGVAARTTD